MTSAAAGSRTAGLIGAAGAAWRRWRLRLTAGVLDQAVVSGANFILNVLLARWLTPAGYGAFAIAYSLIVLLGGPHGALLIDPLNVVGARSFRNHPRPYLRTVLALHGAATAAAAAVIAIAALWPALPAVVGLPGGWVVALALATPLVLSLWLLRSACYLEMRPQYALLGSIVYAALLFILVVTARAAGVLTPTAALGIVSAASGGAAATLAVWLGLLTPPLESVPMRVAAGEHWRYGRWILGASIAHGIASGLYLPIVAAVVGIEQSAVLRALQNLVMPLQQGLAGVALVAYPSMSRRVAERGKPYLKRRGLAFVSFYAGAAVIYGLLLAAVGRPLLAAIYGRGYYTAYAGLVPVFAAAAVALALAQSLSILVRVTDRPQGVLWSKVAAAAWLGLAGIPLVRSSGVEGAIAGLGGGAAVEALVLIATLRYGSSRSAVLPTEDVLNRVPET